ncbi:hypothetical protein IQ06DRAFT_209721 [Phaeosphaeriaceae sp. SRC1lsM3a]|nr:hypothetical protein IQ06DRAFT_209721 [Stagonospora sp. SRC1lsM3a]
MSTPTSSPNLKWPIHWILDWDGTITQKDTLNALVSIAATSKPNFPTEARWKSVVDAYMSDYTSTLTALAPDGRLPTTIEDEKRLLRDLKPVEQRSLDRVFASEIFRDITREQIEIGAKKVVESGEISLRPGFAEFYNAISTSTSDSDPHGAQSTFHILSVNWSGHFIATCLSATNIHIDPAHILANELDGISSSTPTPSTGEISPKGNMKMISSADKLHHLRSIKAQSGGSVVYIGDSWPDIECLIDADVGICIQDEAMGSSQRKLAEALERLGIGCVRLGSEEADGRERGKEGVMWARDFVEIKKWADGL